MVRTTEGPAWMDWLTHKSSALQLSGNRCDALVGTGCIVKYAESSIYIQRSRLHPEMFSALSVGVRP
jgi:hypothetical protein